MLKREALAAVLSPVPHFVCQGDCVKILNSFLYNWHFRMDFIFWLRERKIYSDKLLQ